MYPREPDKQGLEVRTVLGPESLKPHFSHHIPESLTTWIGDPGVLESKIQQIFFDDDETLT